MDTNIYPFSPISFYDWAEYSDLAADIKYRADGKIANNQRPHTQNRVRRQFVRDLLSEYIRNDQLDLSVTAQIEFWRKVGQVLISVCVPGARPNILDRGQLQYMALGACTLSPRLDIELPFGRCLVPGVHYLECRADFADVIDKIEWARHHTMNCIEIGTKAKELFESCLTSAKLWEWIQLCLGEKPTQPLAADDR